MSTPGAYGITVIFGSSVKYLSNFSITHIPRDFRILQPKENYKRCVKVGVYNIPAFTVKPISLPFA